MADVVPQPDQVDEECVGAEVDVEPVLRDFCEVGRRRRVPSPAQPAQAVSGPVSDVERRARPEGPTPGDRIPLTLEPKGAAPAPPLPPKEGSVTVWEPTKGTVVSRGGWRV